MNVDKKIRYAVNLIREQDGAFVVQDPRTKKLISKKLRFANKEAAMTWINGEGLRPGIIIHRKFDDLGILPPTNYSQKQGISI